MQVMLATLGFAAAALCAAVMGYAIQRGATCMVIAVNEVFERRSARRLAAMLEASLWVAGGLLVARALGAPDTMPAGFAASGWTLLGGALLGLGAFVNGACVFGAIARLGSGEWAYLATPAGFLLGCVTFPALFGSPVVQPLPYGSPVLDAPGWVVLLFAMFAAWRILHPSFAARSRVNGIGAWMGELAAGVWTPHAATTVIAITFVIMLILVGAWSYTDTLAELSRDMAQGLPGRAALLFALLLGAVLGGWTAGRLRARAPSVAQVLRCAAGGTVMAWGGLLVPGSNDGLILLAMPLLWPYAWLALAAMCGAIAAARLLRDGLLRPRAAPVGRDGRLR